MKGLVAPKIEGKFSLRASVTGMIQKKLADMQADIALGLQGSLRLGRMFDDHTLGGPDRFCPMPAAPNHHKLTPYS